MTPTEYAAQVLRIAIEQERARRAAEAAAAIAEAERIVK